MGREQHGLASEKWIYGRCATGPVSEQLIEAVGRGTVIANLESTNLSSEGTSDHFRINTHANHPHGYILETFQPWSRYLRWRIGRISVTLVRNRGRVHIRKFISPFLSSVRRKREIEWSKVGSDIT